MNDRQTMTDRQTPRLQYASWLRLKYGAVAVERLNMLACPDDFFNVLTDISFVSYSTAGQDSFLMVLV